MSARLAAFCCAWTMLLALPQQSPAPTPPTLIDPALAVAIRALEGATGYRFVAEQNDVLPFGTVARLACTSAPRRRLAEVADFVTRTRVECRFERGVPLEVASRPIEAFRYHGEFVFRRRVRGEWGPWTNANRIADPPHIEELRLLRLLARLPEPEGLLADLGSRLTSCSRSDDPKRAELTTFICDLRPDAGWIELDRSPAAPTKLARCTLRITVDRGRIRALEFEGHAPDDSSDAHAVNAAAGPGIEHTVVIRYVVDAVGSTKVAVPAEAAKLLESR